MLESPDYFFRVREIGRLCQTYRSDPGSHGGRRAIARCPCTPQEPMKVRGEKINVSSGPSKEIYSGSEEDEDDDARIAKFACVGILA